MGGEPGDLLAVQVGHPEWVSVCGRPDGLHHVPEVEATGDEGLVAKHGERRKPRRVRGDCRGEEDAGTRKHQGSSHSSGSMIARQRAPRTASLALRS